MRLKLLAACAALALASPAAAQTAAPSGRAFTAADLVGLDRASDLHVSPDGTMAALTLRATDLAKNKGVTTLRLIDLRAADAPARVFEAAPAGSNTPRWSADGNSLYFLSGDQVWRAPVAGGPAVQVTTLPLDVQAFRLSPDGRRIVVALAVFPDAEDPAATKVRMDARASDKASGHVYDRLFVRHWDAWADGTRNHLFSLALDADGKASGAAVPLMPGFDGDTPSKPFGGDDDFSISPDGRTVFFSARLAGKSEPWSTNFDVYATPIDGSAAPRDLTAANKAWDAQPTASPDGRYLAYRAMKRPTFEADRFGVMVMDLKTGATREVDAGFDRSAEALTWSPDGRTLYATAGDMQAGKLFAIDVASGKATPLVGTGHVNAYELGRGGAIYYLADSMAAPAQLYRTTTRGGAPVQLSRFDADRLSGVEMAPYESFAFPGWNGETVHGWVVKPHGYVAGKKYPVAFLIHGGPQGSWTDSWSYRWNPQTWAGKGYAVVMVDFHGSTGYGQAFTDAISNHWGDRPLEDLQKGWAAALGKYPWLDGANACALGASYGGFMVNWIAGNWSAPWKCLVTHDGVFDARMMSYATEELWFDEWEHGGKTYAQDPAAYERFNPVNHVAAWTKPQLIIHSDRDYRIPVEQGIGAFTALQRRGVESEFLHFPDENHWVLKPANSLLWHRTVEAWLDAHLKAGG